MTLTYEINDDNSVTILNDGSVFLVQSDDPRVEGWDAFESEATAREWAEEAIERYESEIVANAAALEDGREEKEAMLAAVQETNGQLLVETFSEEIPSEE
jgi:hypothetical protein